MAKAPYSQDLLDRAQAHANQPVNDRRYDQGLTEISELYAAITGEPVGKCRQCQYSDFLAVVTAYIREATRFLHPELMPDSKYTFAPGFAGEVIADGRYNKTVTAENLTDQDAEALLKLGYGHVIVPKPGQESSAGENQPTGTDFIVEPNGKSQVALDLEAEQEAHENTKELLKQAHERIEAAGRAYDELEKRLGDTLGVQNQLASEKQAHEATKAQLADVQQQLSAAKSKLSRKTATTGATDPAQVPAVSTSDASPTPSAPAVTAPAPPSSPAEGTAGN